MSSRRPLLTALVVTVLALAMGAIASGSTRVYNSYAGPKTWLQGWDASGPFDSASSQWFYNEMTPSCWCRARAAWIDMSGTWYESNSWPGHTIWSYRPLEKLQPMKPYCKNNSDNVYTAACNVY
jgi:hypothetical protein